MQLLNLNTATSADTHRDYKITWVYRSWICVCICACLCVCPCSHGRAFIRFWRNL